MSAKDNAGYKPNLDGFRAAAPPVAPAPRTPPPAGGPPAPVIEVRAPGGRPSLAVDVTDPANLHPDPTALMIPEPVMKRYDKARRRAGANMEVVTEALRATIDDLPALVAEARREAAGIRNGDPFPFRTIRKRDRVPRVRLSIEPLVGELKVIDALVRWVGREINAPAKKPVNRSELVTVALDAYLPRPGRPQEGGVAR